MKNTGSGAVSVTAHSARGAGYSYTGIAVPHTLAAGQSLVLTVKFAPTASGVSSGDFTFTSNATNATSQFAVTGTGASSSAGSLSATPSSASFGTVSAGTTNTQTITLKNTGKANLVLNSVTLSGPSLKLGDLTIPRTLAPAQTETFTVAYTPSAAGSFSGNITFKSTAANSTLTIPLSGTGAGSTKTISLSTTSVNFGNETVGGSSSLVVAVKNTGNSSLTVSAITVSGTGFSVSSGVRGATIAAGQTANLNVMFVPKATGSVTGKVTLTSNATNSPNSIATSGTGVSNTAHSVALSWAASATSGIKGYYVYRSTTSGGSYSRVTGSPVATTKYTDGAVASGETYFYVVTALSSSGSESGFSSQVTAEVP